jgi:hypothetical protein
MSRIDRIFCTTYFESIFPLAHAKALPKLGSDHTPIIWDAGLGQHPKKVVLSLKNGGSLDLILRFWYKKPGLSREKEVRVIKIVGRTK